MDQATDTLAFESNTVPFTSDDFADTQEHGIAEADELVKPDTAKQESDQQWPDFSDDDPDEMFVCNEFEEDFTESEFVEEEFNPDTVLNAGWQTNDNSNQPAWRELERRREAMELQRALHDDLFDF